jgi:hypothetical protein
MASRYLDTLSGATSDKEPHSRVHKRRSACAESASPKYCLPGRKYGMFTS